MNKDQFAGRWRQIRGLVKNKWGQLTDDELDQIEGNYEMLLGRIQEKYGTTRAQIEKELEALALEETTRRPM